MFNLEAGENYHKLTTVHIIEVRYAPATKTMVYVALKAQPLREAHKGDV